MSRWSIHEQTPAKQGRLTARPVTKGDKPETPPSIQTLSVGNTRFGLISVPPGYSPNWPAPLLVLLHGAGGEAKQAILAGGTIADETGLILLAPQSEGPTWDVIMGGYGSDVQRIDDALSEVFRRFAIDPHRVAIGGFSDALLCPVAGRDQWRPIPARRGLFARVRRLDHCRGSPTVLRLARHGRHDPSDRRL